MTDFFAGNKRTLYFATQTDKGTPNATPTLAMRVEDFTPNEVRAKIQLAETDRSTQEAGDAVVGFQGGFSFKTYLRPSQAAFFYNGLLGDAEDTGGPTNFAHELTPAEQTPYLTCYEVEPDLLCNRYSDIRVTKIEASGAAGGPIEATITCEALVFEAGATEPTSPDPGDDLPYVYPESSTTKGGDTPGTIDQWQLTIDRNGKRIQGDVGFTSLDYVNGKFTVSGQVTKYTADDADQRQVDTGATDGTDPTVEIYSEDLTITLTRDENTSVAFAMPEVSYPTRTMAVNSDGSPLAEVMGFRTLPQATLAENIVVTVLDQTENADGSPP